MFSTRAGQQSRRLERKRIDVAAAQYYLLTAVTLLAALLRLAHLGRWSFWVDEIFTLQNAQNFWTNLATMPQFALSEHPLTAGLILAATTLFAEPVEWSARLAPALLGVLSVPLLFVIGRWLFGTHVGLVAALILALSPWHLYWSQNARFYVTLLLFFTLAIFFFYRGIAENRAAFLLLALLFLGVAAAERLLALFFVPIVAAYLLLVLLLPWPKPAGLSWRNLAVVFVPGGVVALFLAWQFVRDPALWQSLYFVATDVGPVDIVLQFVRGVDPPILLLGGVGAFVLLRQKRHIGLLLLLTAVMPMLITVAAAFVQFTHGRYTFVSLTAWALLAAVGSVHLLRVANGRWRWPVVVGLAVLLVLLPLQELADYFWAFSGGRPDWKTALVYAEQPRFADAQLVTNSPVLAEYYLPAATAATMDTYDPAWLQTTLCANGRPLLFVVGGNARIDRQLWQWMQAHGEPIPFSGYRMRLYEIRPSADLCAGA